MKLMSLLVPFFFLMEAQAQLALLPEKMNRIPDLPNQHPHSTELSAQSTPVNFSRAQVRELVARLDQQFLDSLKLLEAPIPSCSSNQLPDYLLALHVKGDLDQCSGLAHDCGSEASTPRVQLLGALCESTRFNYPGAEALFVDATDQKWQKHPDFSEAVIQRAAYSLFGHSEDQVDEILSLLPQSTEKDQKLWKGVLRRVGEMDLGALTRSEVDRFLDERILKSERHLKGLLLSLRIRILQRGAQYSKALDDLYSRSSDMKNPLLWYYLAYNTLYYGLDQNFAWSRDIYEVYNRYSQSWMSFPLENNTYNYSQIYGQVCKSNLVPLQEQSLFRRNQKQLRAGELSVQRALQAWTELKPSLGQKADFLTAYAGLLSLEGRHEEAFALYYQAHELCPFYNRAHWGLAVEKRFLQHQGRPDFQKLNEKIDREIQSRPVPSEISTYISNWNSLNPEIQKRAIFGARIFLPYMKTLESVGFHTYLKFGFDLLSDSPDLEFLRDSRIGGPGYPHDNRLWDDVRGVGGDRVVADISEVFNTVQGDYNLLGHEMAHQFQYLLETLKHPGYECIVTQYQEAQANKNFPDAYSAQNKEEHFAQGVTYYLVPTDSPARFGLNQNWLVKNNPAQFHFVQSIDQTKGQMDLIGCPDSASQN